MKKIILYIAQSIDGYIATSDGGVDWLDQFSNGNDDYGYKKFVKNIDCNIQGSNTYKQVLGFNLPWPYKSKSYVITNQKLEKPAGADIEFCKGDIKTIAGKIKNVAQKNIWLIGGAKLTQSFLRESLIDEMIIFTMPVILGSGISLFGTNQDQALQKDIQINMTLNDSKKYNSGVVESHYLKTKS